MAIAVNTNVAAINAIGNLSKSQSGLTENYSHISSGLRIAKAADDAAGLGVAEALRAQSTSGGQAMRNTSDGISIIATAESATNEVADILVRMRELSVQSASGTLADTERSYLMDEFDQLASEVNRIADVTEFNGISLVDTTTTITCQVGVMQSAANQIDIVLGDLTATTLGVTGCDLSATASAQSAITIIDSAIDSVNGYRSVMGATQNRLESALSTMNDYVENLKGAESQIRDLDFAQETADMSRNQILQQAGISMLAQAKGINQGALSLLG